MSGPGSVLAIDYGTRRCGLARSDPDRILATGLPTFERRPGRSFHSHLRELLSEGYALVLLGFPYHDPESGWEAEDSGSVPAPVAPPVPPVLPVPKKAGGRLSLTEEILSLGGWIERELGVTVILWDESLTSLEAAKRLRNAPKAQRRDKAAIDRLAAEILLQEFLDAGCPVPDRPSGERTGSGPAAGEGRTL